ncbi:MAG: tetratricopeptide repeat protein [Chitinophagaceae bacterium]
MQKSNQSANKKYVIAVAMVLIVLVAGYFIWNKAKREASPSAGDKATTQSIAVLPFINKGNEPSQEYFSDGLSDGILNSLANVKGLKVSARFSSFQFRGININIKEVGQKLGVSNVLEGSYLLQGDRIQITAQLFNAEQGSYFWSADYNENIDDMFSLQDKIAHAVSKKLAIILPENDMQLPPRIPVAGPAYDLYLQGRAHWNLRTPPDLKKAINFFKQAIALEPSFARAYSGIADCYTALGYGSHLAPKESFSKAMEAATKALQLDTTLAEPHASLGFYKFYYEWDWAAAEQEFRMAIALNPNDEIAYDYYGYYLTAMKRYEEAVVILAKAAALDPLSVPIKTDIGFSMYYSRNYDTAIARLQSLVQKNPRFMLANLWLGRAYQAKKDFPSALGAYQKALEIAVNWPVALAAIGNAYGVSGDKAAAQKVLDTLYSLKSSRFVTSYGVALVYVGLGEKDKAFEWLTKAIEERSHWLVWLRTDPRWDPLRSDIRFAKLVNTVGLPD